MPLPYQKGEESKIAEKLKEIFGIAWFSFAYKIPPKLENLKQAVKKLSKEFISKEFAVRVKRADKNFPITSIETEKILGRIIVDSSKARVNLKNPNKTLFIEIGKDEILIFFNKIRGLGGLPVGSSGKILCLFSGGIDSPVAAYLLAKRGAEVSLVHFSALAPNKVMKTKIGEIYKNLQKYLGKIKLFIVPYFHFQYEIAQLFNEFSRYEVLLFRRFMAMAATKISKKYHYQALATGDNLSQVASQTLDNIAAVDKGQELPVFRPLIGYDKQEIIDLAQKIGTYDLSIRPYKDCCSLLQKEPVTKGRWEKINRANFLLDMDKMILDSINDMEIIDGRQLNL